MALRLAKQNFSGRGLSDCLASPATRAQLQLFLVKGLFHRMPLFLTAVFHIFIDLISLSDLGRALVATVSLTSLNTDAFFA